MKEVDRYKYGIRTDFQRKQSKKIPDFFVFLADRNSGRLTIAAVRTNVAL